MDKTIDECLFEIFSKQEWSTSTRRLRIYKSRFFNHGLPVRTKIKILQEHGYIQTRPAYYGKNEI